MKKKLLILVLLIAITGIIVILYNNYHHYHYDGPNFYLNDEYYNHGNFININSFDVKNLINDKATFLLFIYNNYCSLPIPCEDIFKEIMMEYKIDILQITFEDLKRTNLYNTIKLAPTIVIVKEGKIIDYLKADNDDDIEKYQNVKTFENWLNKYVILKSRNE